MKVISKTPRARAGLGQGKVYKAGLGPTACSKLPSPKTFATLLSVAFACCRASNTSHPSSAHLSTLPPVHPHSILLPSSAATFLPASRCTLPPVCASCHQSVLRVRQSELPCPTHTIHFHTRPPCRTRRSPASSCRASLYTRLLSSLTIL
jgi:hypothetical protein